MKYEFELARSFMKATGSKRFYHPHILLSILGIAVGVSFLIFSLSIYDGYVKKIETIIFSFYPQISLQTDNTVADDSFNDDSFILDPEPENDKCRDVMKGKVILEDRTLTNNHSQQENGFQLKDFPQLKKQLNTIPGIRCISPIIFEEANFSYIAAGASGGPLRILGVQPENGEYVPEIQRTITNKELLNKLQDSDTQYVIMSSELYKKFFGPSALDPDSSQAFEPRKIQLTMKRENGTAIPPKQTELVVAGVFKLGMHKISENMMITSLATAQEIFNMPGQATFAGLSLNDPYNAEHIAQEIKLLTAENKTPINIYQWMAVAADMFNSLSFYRKIVIVILFMSIIITAFNIYTTLNIMILERKKQIGILMSMGIKKASLYRVFLLISQIEAAIGVAAGILSGVFLGIYFSDYFNRSLQAFLQISQSGTAVDWGTVAFIATLVSMLCAGTTFAATRKGANLDPVESLRSE